MKIDNYDKEVILNDDSSPSIDVPDKNKSTKSGGGFAKIYWLVPSIGTIVLGILLLSSLFAPVMLHEGYNISGIGFQHVFNVYVDYIFTATSAVTLIMSVFVIMLGAVRLVKALAKPYYKLNDTKAFVLDGLICLVVLATGLAGVANSGNWFAKAGAGYSLLIFAGAFGIVLLISRIFIEKKLTDKDYVDAFRQYISSKAYYNEDSANKVDRRMKKASIALASFITIVFVVGIIVSSVYTNPFVELSFASAKDRKDIINRFGIPEGLNENHLTYVYVSSEYSNIDRMSDKIFELQKEGVESLDGIAVKLNEKQENTAYKTTTVVFDFQEGGDRYADSVSSYFCTVNNPDEETSPRQLKEFQVLDSKIIGNTNSAQIEYFAKYDDGSFIKSNVYIPIENTINEQSQLPVKVEFADDFGTYSVSINNFEEYDGSYYVIDDTLYIMEDTDFLPISGNGIRRLVVSSKVTELKEDTLSKFSELNEIILPDKYIDIECNAFINSMYYKNKLNWDEGKALYIGKHLVEMKEGAEGRYFVKDGTKYIAGDAFNYSLIKELWLPASVENWETSGFDHSFDKIYCQAVSKPDSWNKEKSEGLPFVWNVDRIVETNSDYEYYVDNKNQAHIISYKGSAVELEIPSSLDGNTVKGIAERAFFGCQSLKSVVVPETVDYIGEYAFYNCKSMQTIVLPKKMSRIDTAAFYNCQSLASVTIPDGVEEISDYTFEYCNSLMSVVIPDSVTRIGLHAFNGCVKLAELDNSVNLTVLDDGAFYKCESLIQIELGEGLTKIGKLAFYGCGSLIEISVPDTVTDIGRSAFEGCRNLERIDISQNITSLEYGVFMRCSSLTEFVIPEKVTSIDMNAFLYCSKLEKIVISDKITYVGQQAFAKCENITIYCQASAQPEGWHENWNSDNKEIIWNVKEVSATSDFEYYADKTNKAYIIRYIGESEEVVIPDEINGNVVVGIVGNAFLNCVNITSVFIPDSVLTVENFAFVNCYKLTIYCEAEAQPEGWEEYWNLAQRPTVWGYKG